MKRKLDLTAPSAAAASAGFNTRRGAVRKWVGTLPLANLSELGKRVHEALQQVNGQVTSTKHLFHFLEAVGPAAASVLSHLQRQYAHQPLPLNDAGNRAARLAVELLTELLRGYRTVLKAIVPDKEEASPWRIRWYRRELVRSLHRFIRYGQGLIEIYGVLHMDPPEGAWKRIHRCYRLAEGHRLTHKRVPLFDDAKRKSSIGHEYKRLLLATLLPTGSMGATGQREIEATLDRWVELLKLQHPATEPAEVHYVVRLARDLGPLPVSDLEPEAMKSDNTRLLDTRPLCRNLEQRRERGGRGRWWRRETDLDAATLGLLHHHWCTEHHRGEARLLVNTPAEVAIGLGALFHLVGGAGKSDPSPRPAGITLEPVAEKGGNWLGKRKDADVWETVYGEAAKAKPNELPPQAPAPIKSDPAYDAVAGRLVDRSEHGLAVVVARSALRQAAVGMPVAVRTEGTDWLVGTLMRLKDGGEEVEIGVRILLEGALPARLRSRDGQRISPPFDVIVGRTLDNFRAIAAPAISALRSGDPVLEVGGKSLAVQRGAMLGQSRYMDVFIAEIPDPESLATIQQAAKEAAEAARLGGVRPESKTQAPAPVHVPREQRIRELMETTGLSQADAEFICEAETDANGANPKT